MIAKKLQFGDFELDLDGCELTRRGRAVKLERIPMDLLLLLVARHDQLVTRADIADKLWGQGVFLDMDSSINTAVLKLRRVFKDDAQRPTFIKTVGGRGYRFITPISTAAMKQSPVERVMLAVLPFENLSADPEQDYFSDGLTEETICHLGRVTPELMGVIARTSSMAYKGTRKNISQIGQELRVDFVLESSVRREGKQVRITSQLIRVDDQTHVWAATFDSDATSLLRVQNDLSKAIAEQVRVKLAPQSAGLTTSPANPASLNMDAYDLYLRGRHHWNQLTPPGIRRGIAYFEQAVALDPNFALAWSGIADCYSMLPITCDEPPVEILPKALSAARRALELDDSLAEAHTSLGTVKVWMDWDWPGAEAALRRALEINPSYVQAHRYYACLLSHTGRHSEAAAEMQKAREVDPLSPIMHALSGHLRWHAHDYRAAFAHLRDAQAINADLWIVHTFLGRVYESEGLMAKSMGEFQKAFDLSGGGNTEPIAFRAHVQALTGHRAAAEDAIRMLTELATHKYVPPSNIAIVYAGLGEVESALSWLEKAFETRDVRLVFLQVDPRWDLLRNHVQFKDLARRLDLLPR
jgi:TolB-like protein/Flp pilus assembly protein TadD